ncbi:putative G-protein coupled receptor 141 isoform X3 [Camelus bactrianus]|uniref:G-protein coupled receptor 141 isoform X3 n=1 Tax=Camelus bactrianus TaxID=9837 RepID=A0AC58QM33_CAMBA
MQPVPVLFKAEIKHFNSKSSCQERKDNCWKVAGETPQIPTLALLEEAKAVAMHSLQIGKGDSTHVFSPRVFCCFCCRLSPYHPGNHSTRYSLLSTAQCRIDAGTHGCQLTQDMHREISECFRCYKIAS